LIGRRRGARVGSCFRTATVFGIERGYVMDSRKPPVRRRPPIVRPASPGPPETAERPPSVWSRWGWPHWITLGVCSFLGFLSLLFLFNVITEPGRAEREAEEPAQRGPEEAPVDFVGALLLQAEATQRAEEEAAALFPDNPILRMMAVAEGMPNEHAKQIWILAADMVMADYCWKGTSTPLEMTARDLNVATIGWGLVSPPEPGPLSIHWKLDRTLISGGRNWLLVRGEGYSTDLAVTVADAIEDEWGRRMATRLPAETFRAAASLIADASRIHQADSGHGTWNGFGELLPGRPIVIKDRGWSRPEGAEGRYYQLVLEEVAGDYWLEVHLAEFGAIEEDPPYCFMTVCFAPERAD